MINDIQKTTTNNLLFGYNRCHDKLKGGDQIEECESIALTIKPIDNWLFVVVVDVVVVLFVRIDENTGARMKYQYTIQATPSSKS